MRKFIGTFILLFVLFAVTDKRGGVPGGFVPLILFLTILGIGTSFSMQTGTFSLLFITSLLTASTGSAINPARDLGPRIMTAMVGYGRQGTAVLSYSTDVLNLFFDTVFNYRSQYWLWSPILGSFCGGLVACFLYDVFLYLGPEIPINKP